LHGSWKSTPTWFTIDVTRIREQDSVMTTSPELPTPTLRLVYRLQAELAPPLDLGETPHGHRRVIAFTGGSFDGPELSGELVPGGGADWQILRPDGASVADIRYTLRTDTGALLLVTSTGVRHGPPEVLARLARGEAVAPGNYRFRTQASIETSDPDLAWLTTASSSPSARANPTASPTTSTSSHDPP
jgi:hypothetical protein